MYRNPERTEKDLEYVTDKLRWTMRKFMAEEDKDTVRVSFRDDVFFITYRDKFFWLSFEKAKRYCAPEALPALLTECMRRAEKPHHVGFGQFSFDRYHVLMCVYDALCSIARRSKVSNGSLGVPNEIEGAEVDGPSLARAVSAMESAIINKLKSKAPKEVTNG